MIRDSLRITGQGRDLSIAEMHERKQAPSGRHVSVGDENYDPPYAAPLELSVLGNLRAEQEPNEF